MRGLLVLVVLALAVGSLRAQESEALRAFYRGNDHFENGRFEEAVVAWREARGHGADSAALRYNLGTALLRLDRPGEALHQLLLARALDPRDADVRANLEVARARLGGAVPPPPASFLGRLHEAQAERIALRGQLDLFLAVWLVVAGLWCLHILRGGRRGRLVLWALTLLALVFAALLALRIAGIGHEPRAVVLRATPAFSGPSATNYGRRYELPAGSIVAIVERRGDWLRVAAGQDAEQAWVPETELGALF